MRNLTRLFAIWHLGGWMTGLSGTNQNNCTAGFAEMNNMDVFHNNQRPWLICNITYISNCYLIRTQNAAHTSKNNKISIYTKYSV